MARKMVMRGRPGLFFVIILLVFLGLFFLTWKSMMAPKMKTDVQDVYSMNLQPMGNKANNQPQVNMNEVWHRAKQLNGGNLPEQVPGHDFDNPVRLDVSSPNERKEAIISPLSDLLHSSMLVEKEKKPYYMKPIESLKIIGGRMERFIHLDLKGAAPKLSYFKEILPLFSRLGATGLLIEYEDMFPYSGKLQNISALNSYTREQIVELLELAKLNSLQVIPLVQTFGHMEFILKSLQLKGFRESEYTPQVIDITSNSSYALIEEMVDQVLRAHPDATYLHIGCDEVYELGRGKSANVILREKIKPEKLFLRHVKRVAELVAKISHGKVRPIMWDDELRKMADEEIMSENLPKVVDIMVWRYTQNVSDVLDETIWKKYGRLFKHVWAASSFKGATGPRQLYTEPQHHIINHFSWIDVIAKYGRYVSFKGIALTGWQRFDHFATLCELMPVAIPSLAVCLETIKNGGFDEGIHRMTSTLLGCSGNIEMSFPQLNEKERRALINQDCRFPGHLVYYAVQQLWGYKQFVEAGRNTGWLSDYQIKHGFSSPGQLKVMSMRLFDLESKLRSVRTPLEEELLKIFSQDTVDEWLDENIFEVSRQLKQLQEKIKVLSKNTHWARRPHAPIAPIKRPDQDGGTSVKLEGIKAGNLSPLKLESQNSQGIDVRSVDAPDHFKSEENGPSLNSDKGRPPVKVPQSGALTPKLSQDSHAVSMKNNHSMVDRLKSLNKEQPKMNPILYQGNTNPKETINNINNNVKLQGLGRVRDVHGRSETGGVGISKGNSVKSNNAALGDNDPFSAQRRETILKANSNLVERSDFSNRNSQINLLKKTLDKEGKDSKTISDGAERKQVEDLSAGNPNSGFVNTNGKDGDVKRLEVIKPNSGPQEQNQPHPSIEGRPLVSKYGRNDFKNEGFKDLDSIKQERDFVLSRNRGDLMPNKEKVLSPLGKSLRGEETDDTGNSDTGDYALLRNLGNGLDKKIEMDEESRGNGNPSEIFSSKRKVVQGGGIDNV